MPDEVTLYTGKGSEELRQQAYKIMTFLTDNRVNYSNIDTSLEIREHVRNSIQKYFFNHRSRLYLLSF